MIKIFVAGHRGMVGSAIVQALSANRQHELILRTRDELDLRDQSSVRSFFETTKIDQVYLAAARVGGIHANNSYPADFIYDNLIIQANVIHHAFSAGIQRLLFLGSSCIYPAAATQPMSENALLTGPLEPTNEPYAVAKIAGIKLCESYNRQYGTDYRSIMPTNLYGPGDNFHPENSHVLPALIRKFVEAKATELPSVTIWGTGAPRREFLHVADMAEASIFLMGLDKATYQQHVRPMQSHINAGVGTDITIADLAALVADVVGYAGKITYDSTKPDGTPRKLLDTSLLSKMGWFPKIDLRTGIKETCDWYLRNSRSPREV
jgi:GDP-L-fucose synthase